jgi:hypothetical protein
MNYFLLSKENANWQVARLNEEEGAFKPPLLGLPCELSQNYFFPFGAFGVSQNASQEAPANLAP